MTSTEGTPAEWYPDPSGRFEYRWWDGLEWTSSVSTSGQVQDDPLNTDPLNTDQINTGSQPQRGQSLAPAGYDLLSEQVLVVNQKAKLIEVNNEYAVYNSPGSSADNYVVHIHAPLAEPLRSMVVASALSIDTALKQDKRGFN